MKKRNLPTRFDLSRYTLLLFILCVGVVLSALSAFALAQRAQLEVEKEFGLKSGLVVDEVSRRLSLPSYGLKGARGAHAAAGGFNQEQFKAYVDSRDLPREFPGSRGFGFLERVQRVDLELYIGEARANGAPEFAVRSLQEKDLSTLYLVRYIEPIALNPNIVGVDLGSNPQAREAMERAIASGETTLSKPVGLTRDGQRSPGFLLFVPVYETAWVPASAGERWASLRGVLYVPLIAKEVLADLTGIAEDFVTFQLYAGDKPPSIEDWVAGYHVVDGGEGIARTREPKLAPFSHFTQRLRFEVHGQAFTLQTSSTPAFDQSVQQLPALMVLLAGLVLTALLARMAWGSVNGRLRAEALARSMTVDLERLAVVARRTSNAVVITDQHQEITWVNAGFERITGYSQEEVLGRQPSSFLLSEHIDPAELARLVQSLKAGERFEGEILNRAKDGRDYWSEVEIQPLLSESGESLGFMSIESDITDRKEAQRLVAEYADRFKLASDAAKLGIWEYVIATDVSMWDEWTFRIFGAEHSPGSEREILQARVSREQRTHIQAAMAEAAAGDGRATVQFHIQMQEGETRYLLATARLLRDVAGRPVRLVGVVLDITDRHRSEEALRSSEALLDRTGRIGGIGGWELDLSTQEVRWTDQTCRIHDLEPGHKPSAEEAVLYYTEDSRPAISEAVNRAINTGEAFDLELSLRTAKGRLIWVRAAGELNVRDGIPRSLMGAFQDITASKQLSIDIQRSNNLLNSVIESLPCALSVFDASGTLSVVNSQFERLLQMPKNLCTAGESQFIDVIRYAVERGDFGAGNVDEKVASIVERALITRVNEQFEHQLHSGEMLELRRGQINGGGFVTTYTDVSAQRQAEAQARQSSAMLVSALEVTGAGVVIYNADDQLVFCNERYRELYSDIAELLKPGTHFEKILRANLVSHEPPEAKGRQEEWIEERVRNHRVNRDSQRRLPDGRALRVVERSMPDGHVVSFRFDITEVVRAADVAEAASQAKGQFLANMSHEIRTPMNAILGMLALLQRTALTSRQLDYASKSANAARSLLGLLNDILDFSKVEAGKLTLDPEPFEVDHLFRDLAVVLSASVGDKEIEVLFDIDPAVPPRLIGDALRLRQILLNLAGNAIKFTQHGQVVVSLRCTRLGAGRVAVTIAVRDTGIGIAHENQSKIFQGFTQAEASTTRRFGGTGLGLVICQRLVALMG
ncbi:MAG: PAS-domain containing protein, partial [Hydrogenophaga sp.]